VLKKKLPIFVLDDDESVRRALRRLIVSAGFQAETFPSLQSFLDSVPLESQGILILDIRMPGSDGFEVQRKLILQGSPLKIIFITAHAEAGDREYAMKTGAIGFLQKPIND
jgi:FixJ family two-component response regulator